MINPFSTYNGGKNGSGTYQSIINVIPPHNVYFELFAGNGSIFSKKKPALFNVLNDIDPIVYSKWQSLNVSGCIILNLDAISILQVLKSLCSILENFDIVPYIYLDPPYLFSTRRQQQKIYNYEFSEVDHIRLLSVISDIKIPLSISCYPNELYANALNKWNKIKFMSTTRKGLRQEVLYFNYDTPDILHDFSYVGSDYKDRYRLKLYKRNLIDKLKRMDPIQQNFLLTSIIENLPAMANISKNLYAQADLNGQDRSSINLLSDN